MSTLLTVNVSNKIVTDGESAWSPPVLTPPETLTIGLRFLENRSGTTIEPNLDIRSVRAAIGVVDQAPGSGRWALQIGAGGQTADNTTAQLGYRCPPSQLAAAINALDEVVVTYGIATVFWDERSWKISFAGTQGISPAPMQVRDNELLPASAGRIFAYRAKGIWQHEVRLMVAPVVFTDLEGDGRVLPEPPSVVTTQVGGSAGGGSIQWNTIEEMFVPPDFRGTFIIRWGEFARTIPLSIADTEETYRAALETIIGVGNVTVRNVKDNTQQIEFFGDLAGTEQPLLVIEPLNPPLGDVTFDLSLTTAELYVMLRASGTVQLPLSVLLWVAGADDSVTVREAFRTLVTIQSPVIWPDMALVPGIDFARPLNPKTYPVFNRSIVITGQQYFPQVVGDGSSTIFPVTHGLATLVVFVWVFENTNDGAQLVHGTDYSARRDGENGVVVTALIAAPAEDAWFVIVGSAQTVGAFGDGLSIGTDQVDTLEERLAALDAAYAAIAALIPNTPIGQSSAAGGETIIQRLIPETEEIFPGGGASPSKAGLLPAVHNATITSITTVLPEASASTGSIFSNDTGGPLILFGGLKTRGSTIKTGEFAASDGRRIYPVTRRGETNSFFPRDFERERFMAGFSPAMLRAGTKLILVWNLELQLIQANTRAQYAVAVEHGIFTSQSSPATTAPNLENIVWNDTPIFTEIVELSQLTQVLQFGVEVLRAANGVLSANKILYKKSYAADSIPESSELAIRGVLRDFDTRNPDLDARGAVRIKDSGSIIVVTT